LGPWLAKLQKREEAQCNNKNNKLGDDNDG
jgi:hypothetical protein